MCSVSMIGDHYLDIWKDRYTLPQQPYMNPPIPPAPIFINRSEISRAEFDALKQEVEDMKKLLLRAKEYDAKNGEPDCEMGDKVALLKQVAKLVGVDLADVFPEGKPA